MFFNLKKMIFFLCSVFLLSACSSLLTTDTGDENIFVLSSIEKPVGKKAKSGISISKPLLASGLSSHRIALLHDDIQLDYFAGAKWSDPLNIMIQDRMTESLDKSKIFAFVVDDQVRLRPDYFLLLDVWKFHLDFSHAQKDENGKYGEEDLPIARIHMRVKLISAEDQSIEKQFQVQATRQAEFNHIQSYAKAMDHAFSDVQSQIIYQLK